MPWITEPQLRDALGLPIGDDGWVEIVVDAVNRFVDDTRGPASGTASPRTAWGALQLGTRWYSRRNSSDVTAFAEFGGLPPSIDRDIAAALQIDRYFGPAVA